MKKKYVFPIEGSITVIAESYDEAIDRLGEKVSTGDYNYEIYEETVYDVDEEEA